ncbi:MAG: DUF4286 family protein [Pyrinomonadaceae bacterium]
MIIYEITAKVRPDLIGEYERYMLETHIPDLLETGYFTDAELVKVADGVYRADYLVQDRETLEKYFETDVERLRADFAQNFPDGVTVSRQVLEILKTWKKD